MFVCQMAVNDLQRCVDADESQIFDREVRSRRARQRLAAAIGKVNVGAQRTFQIGKGCDFVMVQHFSQGVRTKGQRSHNVLVATAQAVPD
jgi:hypothetical protein